MTPLPHTLEPPVDAFQRGPVLLVSAAHWFHDTYTAFLPPLLPTLEEMLSLSHAQGGLLTVFLQLPSLLQPLIGHLGDRLDRRIFVILAPAVTAVAMSLLGVASSYALLALLLIVAGASSAALHAVVPVLVGQFSGANLGRGMGFWMVGGELGRALGPLIVVSAVAVLGLQGTPWLMGGGLLASALLYARLRGLPTRPAQTRAAFPWRSVLRAMAPLLLPLMGVLVARSFMSAALMTYFPTFLEAEGVETWWAGLYLSVLQAAGVVGAFFAGTLSDRLGRKRVLVTSLLVTPWLMLVFFWLPAQLRPLLLLPLGLTSLAVTPVMMALIQENYPENRALSNGIYMASSFIIRSGVVVLVGALGDWLGLRTTFLICAGSTLLGIPFILGLPVRR